MTHQLNTLMRALSAIWMILAGNAVVLLGVFFFKWRVSEVLLLFWLETALMVLLAPIRAAAREGVKGAITGFASSFGNFFFLAFHAFFLTGLLYGVDWEKVEGGPAGWSAPAKGHPGDWFAAAWHDLPWIGVLCIVGFGIANVIREWPVLRAARAAETGDEDAHASLASGQVVVMHIAIVFGGSAILAAGADWGMLVVLIALKTGYDIFQAVRGARLSRKDA